MTMFVFKAPLTTSLALSDGERVSEGWVRGWTNQFGAPRILSPVSYFQTGLPLAASTARSELSVEPKNTLPSSTSGDESTGPPVLAAQPFLPLAKPNAHTLPSPEPRNTGPSTTA